MAHIDADAVYTDALSASIEIAACAGMAAPTTTSAALAAVANAPNSARDLSDFILVSFPDMSGTGPPEGGLYKDVRQNPRGSHQFENRFVPPGAGQIGPAC